MVRTSTDSTAGLNIFIIVIFSVIGIIIVILIGFAILVLVICIVVASHLYIHFWGNFIFFMKNEDITFFSFHNHLLFFVKISSTMKNLIFLRKFPPPFSCWLAGSCFCRKYKRKEEIEPTYFKQSLKLFVTFSLTKMCSFQLTLYL